MIVLLVFNIFLVVAIFSYIFFDNKKLELKHKKRMEDIKRKHEEEMEKLYPTWQEGMLISCQAENIRRTNTKQITVMFCSLNEELTEEEITWAKSFNFQVDEAKKAKIYNLTDNEFFYILYRYHHNDLIKMRVFLNSAYIILNVKNDYLKSSFLKIKEVIR